MPDPVSFARALAAALLIAAGSPAAGQSADQEIVSVVDSPDPVVGGQTLTYTVTMRNNGPDAAVNGGLNVNLDLNLSVVSWSPPPGFTCVQFGSSLSCTTPSFAPGLAVVTLELQTPVHLNNFPDGTLTSNFFPSGTTPDPNSGNNFKQAVTAYDSPQVDMVISVTDTPDPVGPDQAITYAVSVRNDGPDPATNVNVNVNNNGTLRFQSATAASGFSCALPAVGGAPVFTCSRASVPVGSYEFSVVVLADSAVLGPSDGTVATAFTVAANASNETDGSNNAETESTAYVTPDADLSVAVGDWPDPAWVEGTVEFLVEVANAGPDAAVPARLNIVGDGGLQFVSIDAPLGFTCTSQTIGAAPLMTCTHPSLPPGPPVEFLLTLHAAANVLGEDGGTVLTSFNVNSDRTDPDYGNNDTIETTTVQSFGLFRDGFEG